MVPITLCGCDSDWGLGLSGQRKKPILWRGWEERREVGGNFLQRMSQIDELDHDCEAEICCQRNCMCVLSFKEKGLVSHNWLSMKWVVNEMWSHQRSSSRIWNQLKVMLSHSPCGWRFFQAGLSPRGSGKVSENRVSRWKEWSREEKFYSHLKNRTWRPIDNRQKEEA